MQPENPNTIIYISYSRNNQVLEWVKEFSTHLKSEMESSYNRKFNIVFSENNEILTEAIASAFAIISVVSSGYCNEEKTAWKELIHFKKNNVLSQEINLPLTDGEKISRVFPVFIDKVSAAEINMFEKELEGWLRSVEFIFDAIEGLVRPLRKNDDDLFYGMSPTQYGTQINKTSQAVMEIIRALEGQNAPAKVEEKDTVFLGWTSEECRLVREELMLVLKKAGLNVVPQMDCPTDNESIKSKIQHYLEMASCSVHILGATPGKIISENDPLPMHQINMAKEQSIKNQQFKMFLWNVGPSLSVEIEPIQKKIVTDIRNNIVNNMSFTNVPSTVQLVDDIRSMLNIKEKIDETQATDKVSFMYYFLDEENAEPVTSMLSDVLKLDTLSIGEDPDMDYGQVSVKIVKGSKLAVVFFKESVAWAIPFIQQIWKNTGGASSKTPLMLIGDESNPSNMGKSFPAPNVVSKVVSNDIIPLEIKVMYDKIVGKGKF